MPKQRAGCPPVAPTWRALATAFAIVNLSGCLQEMANQPRIEPYEQSRFFADQIGSRYQPAGTIARGQLWEETPDVTGRDEEGQLLKTLPLDVDAALLQRGHELFGIFCDHCHGTAGYGDGMVVQRGFPQPPSYHIDRLREAADGHIFRVITEGHGRMPAYGARIAPRDRWALVAYVRTLQLSQHVPESELSATDREGLPKQ